jgi:transcriptional regulator with XRE-family HTH domain
MERATVREDFDTFQRVRRRVAMQVRRLRTGKGLTQETVAATAGLAPRHLQKIEAAEVNVTLDTLVKVAGALDVDVRELFQEQPSE